MDEQPQIIPATEAQPLPSPPTSGNWRRLPDGGLAPADEATAQTAGLAWGAPGTDTPEG